MKRGYTFHIRESQEARKTNVKNMVSKIRRNFLFFTGVAVTGVASFVGNSFRGHFSKNESLVVPETDHELFHTVPWAHADGPPLGGCFPAGCRVSTPVGDKPIESLSVGDQVYGFDVNTGTRTVASVVKTFRHAWEEVHERSPLLILTHAKGVCTITANHWVYRRNDRDGEYANFDRAGMLVVGDILTLEDGSESVIEKIESGPEYDFVYNLTVEGVHTYFADGVRVHNRNGGFFIPTASADDGDGGDGGDGGGGGGGGGGGCDGGGCDGGAGGGSDGSDDGSDGGGDDMIGGGGGGGDK